MYVNSNSNFKKLIKVKFNVDKRNAKNLRRIRFDQCELPLQKK